MDEIVEVGGELYTLVDTAGIRRRVHLTKGADYYASLRTSAAIERAESRWRFWTVPSAVGSGPEDSSEVVEAGRALVLAFNKWDLVGEDERFLFERSFERTSLTSRGRRASTCPR